MCISRAHQLNLFFFFWVISFLLLGWETIPLLSSYCFICMYLGPELAVVDQGTGRIAAFGAAGTV